MQASNNSRRDWLGATLAGAALAGGALIIAALVANGWVSLREDPADSAR